MAAEDLAAALRMAAREWEVAFRCIKPTPGDALVLASRTHRRAAWAAHVAADAGLPGALVFRQVHASALWPVLNGPH